MSEAILQFDNLTLGYGSHPAVHHLSGAVSPGALTAIVGANGSGKSTLLKGIAGLIQPMGGSVKVASNTRIAYLPQQSEIDRSFPARVIDIVSLGLWPSRGLFGRHSTKDKARVTEAIGAVGLSGFEERPLDTLSGGQMQRALFARVIVQEAQLILLDEPFNGIDSKTLRDLLVIIHRWSDEDRTVLAVLHDVDLVRENFPQALLLARRPVAWGATGEVLTEQNLAHTRDFDEPWHDEAPWCEGERNGHRHEGEAPHTHDHSGHAHDHSHDYHHGHGDGGRHHHHQH